MNRKQFFESLIAKNTAQISGDEVNANLQTKTVGRRTNTGIAEYTGTFGDAELMHLLRRSLFGVKVSDWKNFQGKSLKTVVDSLLSPTVTQPNPPINYYGSVVNDPNVPLGSTWVNAPLDPNVEPNRKGGVKAWFWGLTAFQNTDLLQKMVMFWHNHFAIQFLEIPDSRACYTYLKTIHTHALGNLKTLTKAVTVDPAMLFYLNGRLNTKAAPDENYARELQELFTVGKGPNSKYTEDDVKQIAKILTGWNINPLTNPFSTAFVSSNHDSKDKVLSSFYGGVTIKGRTGLTAGELELDDLLTAIFNTDESALFICRKLYRFFVYYEIDSNTETNVIAPLAKVFKDSGYDIKTVLQTLLMSEHFFDNWNRGCVIKDPITHQAGFCRQMEVAFPAPTNYLLHYQMLGLGQNFGQITQMNYGDPPNVAGWPAWYQEPLYDRSWINSDTLPKRNQFTDYLLYIGHKIGSFTLMADPWIVVKQFSNPGVADDLINETITFLLPQPLTTAQVASIKAILLPGGIPDYNWKDEYRAATTPSDPNYNTAYSSVTSKLKYMFKFIMNLAEYQLS